MKLCHVRLSGGGPGGVLAGAHGPALNGRSRMNSFANNLNDSRNAYLGRWCPRMHSSWDILGPRWCDLEASHLLRCVSDYFAFIWNHIPWRLWPLLWGQGTGGPREMAQEGFEGWGGDRHSVGLGWSHKQQWDSTLSVVSVILLTVFIKTLPFWCKRHLQIFFTFLYLFWFIGQSEQSAFGPCFHWH